MNEPACSDFLRVEGQNLLSVIVPLAAKESGWTALLEQLRGHPLVGEVILANSAPRNEGIATKSYPSYRLIECFSASGRAIQMNAGARVATGRWLWFLHADSCLSDGAIPALETLLRSGQECLAHFRLGFIGDGPCLMTLNAIGANLRSRWLKLPFGDQGFVLPSRLFWQFGGYDESRTFGEDHQLVWRVRSAGLSVVGLPATVLTSARKYKERGWIATTLRHVWLTALQAGPEWYRLLRRRSG
ncbi:TIGR04283 family arsenosugar biosynthesis glycosyltransferase [Nevskia soli]|uniref:TIGR04283 family arsenosugar biosynthesis glycosyltransferase n=1 Tax=Nevskia soli TaxID=418856 RepID=UPI00069120A5|nr:glycosyltransferase family 2 protein [Nevskia soli]